MIAKRLIIILLAIIAVALFAFFLPVGQWLIDAIRWMRANPGTAELVYGLILAASVLLMLPTFLLMVAGGFLFGLIEGGLLTWLVYQVSAVMSFMIGRTFARGWVEKRIAGSKRFEALDHAIHGTGFKIVFLTRVALLIPYNILNYVYGLTKVHLRDYALGSALGSIPLVVLYVYIGTTVTNLANLATQAEDFAGDWWLIAIELALVVTVILVVIRIASRELRKQLNQDLEPDKDPHNPG